MVSAGRSTRSAWRSMTPRQQFGSEMPEPDGFGGGIDGVGGEVDDLRVEIDDNALTTRL
jgi:hypothetical protein